MYCVTTTTEGSFHISVSRGLTTRIVWCRRAYSQLEKRQQKVNSQLPVFTEAP